MEKGKPKGHVEFSDEIFDVTIDGGGGPTNIQHPRQTPPGHVDFTGKLEKPIWWPKNVPFPEEAVWFTQSNPTCVYIYTPHGWIYK